MLLVDCRGGNDIFESNGKVCWIKIDFIGYLKLREDFYNNNIKIYILFGWVFIKECFWFYIFLVMVCYGDFIDRVEFVLFYKKLGYLKIVINLIFCFKGLVSYIKKIKLVKMVIKKIFL